MNTFLDGLNALYEHGTPIDSAVIKDFLGLVDTYATYEEQIQDTHISSLNDMERLEHGYQRIEIMDKFTMFLVGIDPKTMKRMSDAQIAEQCPYMSPEAIEELIGYGKQACDDLRATDEHFATFIDSEHPHLSILPLLMRVANGESLGFCTELLRQRVEEEVSANIPSLEENMQTPQAQESILATQGSDRYIVGKLNIRRGNADQAIETIEQLEKMMRPGHDRQGGGDYERGGRE